MNLKDATKGKGKEILKVIMLFCYLWKESNPDLFTQMHLWIPCIQQWSPELLFLYCSSSWGAMNSSYLLSEAKGMCLCMYVCMYLPLSQSLCLCYLSWSSQHPHEVAIAMFILQLNKLKFREEEKKKNLTKARQLEWKGAQDHNSSTFPRSMHQTHGL